MHLKTFRKDMGNCNCGDAVVEIIETSKGIFALWCGEHSWMKLESEVVAEFPSATFIQNPAFHPDRLSVMTDKRITTRDQAIEFLFNIRSN